MAKINRQCCFYENQLGMAFRVPEGPSAWKGFGWAKIPIGWPLWWLLLRIWLFLRWVEGNLRLTATVWGLLKCEVGTMPQWSDFMVWRWMKRKETDK